MIRKDEPEYITETCTCDKCKKLIYERKTVVRKTDSLFFSEKRAKMKEASLNPHCVSFIKITPLHYNSYEFEKHFCIDCGIVYINENLTNEKDYVYPEEFMHGYDIRKCKSLCCRSDLIGEVK